MSDSSDLGLVGDPSSPPESATDLFNEFVAQLKQSMQQGECVLDRDSSGCVFLIQRHDSLQQWIEHQENPHRWISSNTSVLEAGADGRCLEERDFKKLNIVKPDNFSENEVWIAEGTNTDVQHILKLIPDKSFRPEEVLAHAELQHGSDDISKLMLVRKDGDNWALHFELVPDGERLSNVRDEIKQRTQIDQEFVPLVPQFALCFLHLTLKVWQYMCQKSWAHMDLTGENILISKKTLRVVVIDFGSAVRLSLGDQASSRISEGSEQDYADILHRFIELTGIIMPGDEKERTTSLFGRCQEIANQHGRGYTSPDRALRLNQIQQLLFPGEVAFRCFLEAMVLRTVDKDSLKDLLEGLLEGNNPAAILDMRHADIGLLTSEDVQRIDQTLQEWGVLDSSSNHGPFEQFFERLKQAVSGATDLDYKNIPSHVHQVINVALEVKMTSIIKKTMSKLFPAYYEERAVDGQQPVGETSQQSDTDVPHLSQAHAQRRPLSQRQGVSQAAAAASQPWSSENFQAPVAGGLPRPSQQENFQAPVAGGLPQPSQQEIFQAPVAADLPRPSQQEIFQAPVAADLPRPSQQEIFQAPVAGGLPWPSQQENFQAPVAADLSSQREIFQAPVAGGVPLSSQHGGPQVAVSTQHPSDPPSASKEKPEAVGGEEAEAATLMGDQGASSEGAMGIRKEENI